VRVEDACWSNYVDDTFFSANGVGMGFHGANANAWVVRTSIFNVNGIGALFDLGGGTGYGILFTDGTHFEDNKIGVELRSGDLHQVAFTDPYVETLGGEPFLKAVGGESGRLRAHGVRVEGGFAFVQDTSPFLLDASGPGDHSVDVAVHGMRIRTSASALPLVWIKGWNARWNISSTTVVDSVGRERRF
jgi:hypothetical protein